MYFKVREVVEGYYEYAMPLDDRLLREVNEYLQRNYPEVEPLILEELINIVTAGNDGTLEVRKEKYHRRDWKTHEVIEVIEMDYNYDVYEYLCESVWDYDVSGFECYDTLEIERKLGESYRYWED